MPPENPPTDPAAQLQWLTDRAAISDLLIDFARALDDQDWDGYAANYTDDGVLAISPTIAHTGRDGMGEFVAAGLGQSHLADAIGTWLGWLFAPEARDATVRALVASQGDPVALVADRSARGNGSRRRSRRSNGSRKPLPPGSGRERSWRRLTPHARTRHIKPLDA